MDTIDIKNDTVLLDLLSSAPPERLYLLVNHLTDAGGGRVMLPSAVKELLLESRHRGVYTARTLQLMIVELQQFGGDPLTHLVRAGAVTYSTIVDDVLKYLGGHADPNLSVKDRELQIVSIGLEDVWLDLSEEEVANLLATKRPCESTPATLSLVQGEVLLGGSVAALAALILSERKYKGSSLARTTRTMAQPKKLLRTILPVLAGPIGIAAMASTAFHVTVPCVMHITYLRQARATVPKKAETTLQPLAAAENHDAGSFLIGGSRERPLLSVEALPAYFAPKSVNLLNLGHSNIDRLGPILQAIPTQVAAGEVASNRYLKVVVNGPLTSAADGNGLRGYASGANGKFEEHARFYEDNRLSSLINGAAILQLGSIVLAQKHLADINRKLGEIKEGIDRIDAFQKNERKATINGTMQYLLQIAPVVLGGNVSSSVRDELESTEKALGIVQDHIRRDIRDLISEVATLKDPSLVGGSSGIARALQQRQDKLDDLAMQWELCLAARFVACRLVCCYSGEGELVRQRQQTLNGLADSLLGSAGFLHEFSATVGQRISTVKGRTDSLATLQANKERLLLWEADRLPLITQHGRAMFQALDGMLQESAQPVAMLLETQGNRILRAMTV